ncbi:hypothetical protein [Brevibacterium ihuae]|uniref:hypothetical protein n=1 Tax=Brevibacterium ihuae TaxID=1631743 RepID=UPI000C75BCD0|nr:hypothetical protein [Brevibacterium ihuae]
MRTVDNARTTDTRAGAFQRHLPLLATEVICLAAVVVAVVTRQWSDIIIPALLIPAGLVPLLLERWARTPIPAWLQGLYAALLLSGPFLGSHLHFYAVWGLWDTVVHFYSGILIALGTVYALGIAYRRTDLTPPPWFEAVVVIAVSGLVALLWEMSEFTADIVVGTNAQRNNTDTMVDLVAGTSAAVLVAIPLLLRRRRGASADTDAHA